MSGTTATVNGELQCEGDAYGQTKVAFEVIAKALAEVGYELKDIVRSRVYVSSSQDIDEAGRAHGELLSDIRPALTILSGVAFVNPKMLVEVEVDAWKRGQ